MADKLTELPVVPGVPYNIDRSGRHVPDPPAPPPKPPSWWERFKARVTGGWKPEK